MIFVIMGMDVFPFDRLARAVDELQASGRLGDDFFIQLGACTYEPKHAKFERFLSFGDLCDRIRESSVVITHAGAGSTLTCIQQGKYPILIPRRARDGEIVDEHQHPFTKKMCEVGLTTAVYEMDELAAAIDTVRARTDSKAVLGGAKELVSWLEDFWSALPRSGKS